MKKEAERINGGFEFRKDDRIKLKFEYSGITWRGTIALHITFTATGAQGTMYISPDALPGKYGME